MNYFQHHIGDYRRDTAHLSLLEHGVYRQLMDMYYLAEQKIPEETEVVYRRLCARTDEEKKAVDTVLAEFFSCDSGWSHTRCDREIAEYQGKAERARSNGKLGGRPSKTKEVISGNLPVTEMKANHKPLTNNHKPLTKEKNKVPSATPPVELFDGVDPQVVKDFTALRARNRAPITATAMAEISKQASLAGLTLDGALRVCCARGWRGFKAEWVEADKPRAGAPTRGATRQSGFEQLDYSEGIEDGRIT